MLAPFYILQKQDSRLFWSSVDEITVLGINRIWKRKNLRFWNRCYIVFFFNLLICTFLFHTIFCLYLPLLLSQSFVHLLIAWSLEVTSSYPNLSTGSRPSSPLHFFIHTVHLNLPAFESKAHTAYIHLSLAFKKLYFFFLQLKNMFKYLAPIFTAVWHL